ncbi:hypothetical protein CRYUN_Cryun13aG0033400 [Craigia yunnanensis]
MGVFGGGATTSRVAEGRGDHRRPWRRCSQRGKRSLGRDPFSGSDGSSGPQNSLPMCFRDGSNRRCLVVYRKITTVPPMQACNALLDGLVKLGQFDLMWDLYNELLSRGFLPNVVTYGVLINCGCCQADVSKARKLFHELLMKGIQPNVVVYTTVIKVL